MNEAFDPETFRRQAHAVVDRLADHLAACDARVVPVLPWAEPHANVEAWSNDFTGGADPIALFGRCFRHRDDDERQERIRRTLLENGAFYVVKTRLRGKTYLRTTLLNPRTTIDDLARLVTAIRAVP